MPAQSRFTGFLHRVVAEPRIYDLIQRACGFETSRRRLQAYLNVEAGQLVMEAGAGTGNWASLVPASATYVWLDNDAQKLAGYRNKTERPLALLGDVARMGIGDHKVDHVLCIAVTHHIPDSLLPAVFAELARTCRHTLLFLDAVRRPRSPVSHLLWKYDRGSFPRSGPVLLEAMRPFFDVVQTEYYTTYHRYLLCVARPRGR
jgi:ubiquinone/menaquinone biosynthesis C-methylase UbiE